MSALYFFMLQHYEGQGVWVDTATREVQLKPRTYSDEPDPVAAYAVRHMKRKQGGPFRVKVRELHDGILQQTFVVHSDGTRTVINDEEFAI